jgi:hypothetical protein
MWQFFPLVLFLFSYYWCFASQGASTLYGPHTLSAYIQEFKKLASAIITGQPVEPGPQPPDLLEKQISLLTPVVMDATPRGVNFGDVSSDVPKNSTFKRGNLVTVTFWSACPRNDLKTEGTFALVEILRGKDAWVPAYDDDDFCLRYKWSRMENPGIRISRCVQDKSFWCFKEYFGISSPIHRFIQRVRGCLRISFLLIYVRQCVKLFSMRTSILFVYIYMYGYGWS